MKLKHLLPFLLACTLASQAQTYTAKRVVFKNPGGFSQEQLEATAQIHPGTSFKEADLSAAAQRFADTGYFADVGASLDGLISASTVVFDLKPVSKADMVRVGFENFVWLTHDELEAAIKAKFPAFIDYLPENSPQADVVTAALTEALAAKSVQARIAHETLEPTLAHPERVIQFRVERPVIRVANLKLTGVTPELVPLIQKSVNATARTTYNDGPAGTSTRERVLAPLLDAGYADAGLTDISLTPNPGTDGGIAVVLTATLKPGDIYHVSHIGFVGDALVTANAFAATQKLHDGDVASRKVLLETLAPVDAAYRNKGYMDVIVNSGPVLDRTQHLVAYTVTVTPGQQYRMHEVKAVGLDPAAKKDFDKYFLMKTGELYNPDYVTNFLKNNSALKSLDGYNAAFKAYADPSTHTVDLDLTFAGGGGR